MNPNLVHNQCTTYIGVRFYTNVGYTDYTNIQTLNPLPMQKYVKPSSMTNILSLAEITSAYDVRMNTKVDPDIYVHAQGFKNRFDKLHAGVYYLDIDNIIAYVSTDTVSNNKYIPPMSSEKRSNVQQVGTSETDTILNSTNINTVYPYPVSVLSTVENNKEYFIQNQIEG